METILEENNQGIGNPEQKTLPALCIPPNFSTENLRLTPIDQPSSLFMRLVFRVVQRMFGRVLLVVRIVYNRDPSLLKISRAISGRMQKSKLPLSHVHLIQAAVSMANGCAFCYDLSLAMAMQKKIGPELFKDLTDFEASTNYSDRFKSMLHAALAVNACRLDNANWQRLRTHCTEAECLELVWLATAEGYYNRLNHALEIPAEGLAQHV